MKKLGSLLLVALTLLLSCQKTKRLPVKDEWLDFRKAYALLGGQRDSAFYLFNKLVAGSRDSLQIALAYNNMAVIQSDAGDYFGAQEDLALSLRFLDEKATKNFACLATDYNELGMTSFNLKNYAAAIPFYDRAVQFTTDSAFKAVIFNNQANAYQRLGNYPAALKLYQRNLNGAKKDPREYARLLSNMARTKWLQNADYMAAPELLTALSLREKQKDLWGQNASYAHLSDYYSSTRPDSAWHYAKAMYAVARQVNSPDDRLEALQKLIKLSAPGETKRYFAEYQQLGDSLQTVRNAAKNQFALIRYNVEKQKADNLALQKDNAEKKYQLGKQRIMLYLALLLLVAAVMCGSVWYRKRKAQALAAIRENELRLSRRVHDVVANGIYGVMSEIEHQDLLDKERLLDKMEILYERSRDISYEPQPAPHQIFYLKIADLLLSYATPTTKVISVGNEDSFWTQTATSAQREIELVLQELMTNMKKHSAAKSVIVKFEEEAGLLKITYQDDGIGFSEAVLFKNGLKNTGNRMEALSGDIIFEGTSGTGLKVLITWPKSM